MKTRKPWGMEELVTLTAHYALKKLSIKKGQRLSLQYHRKKTESILVLRGKLQLTYQPQNTKAVSVLKPGQHIDILPLTIHRFEAPFGPVELLEVSTPELEDLVRLEDDYGRA